MKLEFSRQIFEKSSNINFHEKFSVGTEVLLADGQTDRHDEANSCFVKAPKNFVKFLFLSGSVFIH